MKVLLPGCPLYLYVPKFLALPSHRLRRVLSSKIEYFDSYAEPSVPPPASAKSPGRIAMWARSNANPATTPPSPALNAFRGNTTRSGTIKRPHTPWTGVPSVVHNED